MENAIEVSNLSKKYDGFHLQDISFKLPKGSIMGLVGENGAGKSTAIKLILNLIHKDSGDITVLGLDNIKYEKQIKDNIGVVFDQSNFPDNMIPKDISLVMKNIYGNWDDNMFNMYLNKFCLPLKKTVNEYSRGMKMKLSLAVAMSHHAKILILDEATSGLDPIIRDEILDIFLDFIQDENHSILISSHIISDLEKIADYITFIHNGKIMFSETKDSLLYDFGILKCSNTDYEKLDKDIIIGCRKNQFGVEALIKNTNINGNYIVDHASIEDIMLFQIKGERK